MEINNEELAGKLSARVKTSVKTLKILVGVAMAVLLAAGVYGILALTVIDDKQTIMIGFIVLISCLVLTAVAVISVLVYAYYNLNKLKKLK